jgi:beta-lactamase regulating signal transducer with metallopeptidase domain
MNIAFDLHLLSQVAMERMLNGGAIGVVIAFVAMLLTKILGRKSAGTRFAVIFATLLAIAGLSFVTISGTGVRASHAIRPEVTLPTSWAAYLFVLWLAGVVFGLVRIGVGLREVSRLRRRSQPIEISSLDPILQETLKQFSKNRNVSIRVSDELRVPTAIGFMKPAVLLPAWALKDLSASELNAVLTHELAHLRRWDDWTKLAEKLISAVLFFHPAVWWIQARLGLEREIACDDLVLSTSGDARGYAECLVSVVERSRMRSGFALALAAISRVRQTSIRITQILDPNRPRSTATRAWKPAVAMVTVLSAATLVSAPRIPQLVSFHDDVPVTRSTAARMVPAVYTPEARPRLVPARFELKAQPESSTPLAERSSKHPRKINRAHVVLTKARTHSQQRQPRTVRASFTEQSVQPAAVLVVFESQQFDDSGSSRLTICVWKFAPSQKSAAASEGIASKSI